MIAVVDFRCRGMTVGAIIDRPPAFPRRGRCHEVTDEAGVE